MTEHTSEAVFYACESTVGRNGAEIAAQVAELKEARHVSSAPAQAQEGCDTVATRWAVEGSRLDATWQIRSFWAVAMFY